MPNPIAGMRPDPRVREPQLAHLLQICAEVSRTGKGRFVFLSGPHGSGGTETLRALAERLRAIPAPRPTVVQGTLETGGYEPLIADRRPFEQTLGLLGEMVALPALFTNPQLFPVIGLVAQLLQVGAVSATFVRDSFSQAQAADSGHLLTLKRNLREAASHRPVVCLLDGLDNESAHVLNTLFVTSTGELVLERPLCIVASLEGAITPPEQDSALPYAEYVAASLLQRGLASWIPLPPLSEQDITRWLGPAQPTLIKQLLQATSGNADWLRLLWNDLWTRGAVQFDSERGRWIVTDANMVASLGSIEDILVQRLLTLIDTSQPDAVETTLYALAIAALEGPVFTAASLAQVLDWEEDVLIDFVDEALVQGPDRPNGILEEVPAVTVPAPDADRCLWRYRFASDLFWYALTNYAFAVDERADSCFALAEALRNCYGSEARRVARALGRLYSDAGERGKASVYREMGDAVRDDEDLLFEGTMLLAAPREDWQPADFSRSAKQLNDAAARCLDHHPYHVVSTLAEAAFADAKRAEDREQSARALSIRGLAASGSGDPGYALTLFGLALPIWDEMSDVVGSATTLSHMGSAHLDKGDPPRALEMFAQALPILRQSGERAGEAATLTGMGVAYYLIGEPKQALQTQAQALTILRQIGERAGEAATLTNMGGVYDGIGEPQTALELFEQALSISRQVGDRAVEAKTLNNMAGTYEDIGEPQRALELYAQALSVRRAVGDLAGEATTLNNQGSVYWHLGQRKRALDLFQQALPIHCQLGDRNSEAIVLNNIGGIYWEIGEPQRALEMLRQALPIHRQTGDRNGEATVLNNLGGVYRDIGEPQRALDLFEQALPIRRQVGDRAGEAAALTNMGVAYRDLGEPKRALELFEQALPIRRQVGDRAGEATTLTNMGVAYWDLGKPKRALRLLEQALPIRREVGDRAGEATTLHNMGAVYQERHEPLRAQELYARALPLRRQVGDLAGELATLTNLGRVYRDIGEHQRELEVYSQALPIHREISDRAGEASAIGSIGRAASGKGAVLSALKLLLLAKVLFARCTAEAPAIFGEEFEQLRSRLGYDDKAIERLRGEVVCQYEKDRGDRLINEATTCDGS